MTIKQLRREKRRKEIHEDFKQGNISCKTCFAAQNCPRVNRPIKELCSMIIYEEEMNRGYIKYDNKSPKDFEWCQKISIADYGYDYSTPNKNYYFDPVLGLLLCAISNNERAEWFLCSLDKYLERNIIGESFVREGNKIHIFM